MRAASRAAISRPNARRAASNVFEARRRSSQGAAGGGQARGRGQRGRKARPNAWAACCPITGSPPCARSRIGRTRSSCMDARAWASPCWASSTASRRRISPSSAEQDILGDRMVRPHARAAPGAEFPHRSLEPGAGRSRHPYRAWRRAAMWACRPSMSRGAPHDCLELQYDGGKLFLPVENIELLTRYGADEGAAQLDRLGGAGWQQRKARDEGARARDRRRTHPHRRRARIEIAAADRAAARPLRRILRPLSLSGNRRPGKSHRRDDRGSGQGPADGPAGLRRCRLRQDGSGAARGVRRRHVGRAGRRGGADHASGAPALPRLSPSASRAFRVKVRQLSRFVDAKEAREDQGRRWPTGDVDIVIGTHALLAKSIKFEQSRAWSSSTRSSISAWRTRNG